MDATMVSQPVGAPGWRERKSFRDARIHMVGIGGSGMCGLAAVLLRRGARISGSDRNDSAAVQSLQQRGARISTTQAATALPPDAELVVASAAIASNHPELAEAGRRGTETIKYAQMLGLVMAQHQGIAIAGTHGKSTTTAWLTYVLRQAGLDPSFVIGADVEQLGGGSGVGDGPWFVAEACEYDRSFLNLHPASAVILNIEEDHLDYYRDLNDIKDAFAQFAGRVPPGGLVLLNGQDAVSRELKPQIRASVETFGLGEDDTWRAVDLQLEDGRYAFGIEHNGKAFGTVRIGLSGRHNVMNALGVTGLAHRCGVPWDAIRAGLATFGGARRRLETRGQARCVTVVDDYAHHPTEIRATLRAARERFAPKRLWCVFQPHQHSRTRFLLADFARSFELADRVIVPQIYFVRDSDRDRELVCAEDLVEQVRASGVEASYIADFDEIVAAIADKAEPGDLVMTMGAGDIWKVADELVGRLRSDLPR